MSCIDTKSIDLSMKKEISDIYLKYGHNDSAHSFVSLFIWKEDMNLEIAVLDDFYVVKDGDEGENVWFFPVGSEEKKLEFIERALEIPGLTFTYMTEEDTGFLKAHFPGRFEIELIDSHSEYIIDRDTLENLPGSAFSKSRGYIRRLQKTYEMETLSIRDLPLKEVFGITRTWEQNRKLTSSYIDRQATVNALNNMDELGVSGIVLTMDGVPCGVAAGFNLNDSTIDCCIEKTTAGMQGLTCLLRQEFVKSFSPLVTSFNWEEDLGLEGLRQAKNHMHPSSMVEMYTGRIK